MSNKLVLRSPRNCTGLRKWSVTRPTPRVTGGGSCQITDKTRSLKRKESWPKLLLLGIQTGDKKAKPPFFVAYSRLCPHCRNLAGGGCLLSRFHFTLCRYFLDHVACRNLPWRASRKRDPEQLFQVLDGGLVSGKGLRSFSVTQQTSYNSTNSSCMHNFVWIEILWFIIWPIFQPGQVVDW